MKIFSTQHFSCHAPAKGDKIDLEKYEKRIEIRTRTIVVVLFVATVVHDGKTVTSTPCGSF